MKGLLIDPEIIQGERGKFKLVEADLLRVGQLNKLVVDDVLVDVCQGERNGKAEVIAN